MADQNNDRAEKEVCPIRYTCPYSRIPDVCRIVHVGDYNGCSILRDTIRDERDRQRKVAAG